MVKAKLNNRFEIVLPEHRANREEWYKPPYWEAARLDSMNAHIGKGDVVYYVGAEIGEMPALCAVWGAEVALFEPNHTAWPVMRATWEANKLPPPLACYAGFVSNVHAPIPCDPNLELNRDLFKGHGWELEDGWPLFSKGDIVEAHGFSELSQEGDGLPQYKLDILVEEGLKPPTALIIDVEGSENQVLKGAKKTLEKYRPKIWLSLHPEMLFANWRVYSRNLRDFIINRGYTETFLDWAHEAHFYYEPSQ